MKLRINKWLLRAALVMVVSPFSHADISFNQNQSEVVFAPTCDHVPIYFQYAVDDADFNESQMTVNSNSDWAIASVDTELNRININFDNADIIASYTATISVSHGDQTTELFVQATVPPLDVYRLVDDPTRSVTYGIQKNGINKGSIFSFDPLQETLVSCLTVGKNPTDFVINEDSTELLVINSIDQTIDVIDLTAFRLKETIQLPEYGDWSSSGETTANIDLGPNNIIYYSDGSWGPVLRVLNRDTNEVLQSIIFGGEAPSNNTGFMDFAITSDKTRMVAMPQYGWSAGGHSSIIGQYSVNADGTVNFDKSVTIDNFAREPFEAPVLLSEDDQVAVMKTAAVDTGDIDNRLASFSAAIWSMTPNGKVVATSNALFEFETGNELYAFSSGNNNSAYIYSKAQAFTSDYSRFIYFNSDNRTLHVVDLIAEIGSEVLGRTINPQNGSVVSGIDTLTWTPIAGIDQYDVYLGTSEADVANADINSSVYLGRVTGSDFALLEALLSGTQYFWRVDPVGAEGPITGNLYSFTVSRIALDKSNINEQTVAGFSDFKVSLQLSSAEDNVDWTATSPDNWVSFVEDSGTTPSTLNISFNATDLPLGLHKSSITLTNDDGALEIPVTLRVNPIHLTHIRSDRNSSTVYAISEENSNSTAPAYLLEIDSTTESITRVVPVGSSVTDLTIHYADNLLYVTNWRQGNLLAIDKTRFELVKTIAFETAGATGYSSGDVYRVAAGVSDRIVVEPEDQWIDISLFNTNTETELAQAAVREGGGAFGPGGRYYYHGENNSSGASIIKYDTSGDTFTQLATIRPTEIASYYGSRTVVVSEDGSRIFWSGVVFDSDLETEWVTGQIIHSASEDGKYAFATDAIFDVSLRRQVFSMPTSTSVSGFNSTTEKLIIEQAGELKFYEISSQETLPAPELSLTNKTADSAELSWNDNSLEMGFAIQSQRLGETTWTDVVTTEANQTSWTVSNLETATSYGFRVRAFTEDNSSPWSNVIYKQEDDVLPALGSMLSPQNGAVVNAPGSLSWTTIPWIESYDVYLGTDQQAVLSADQSSSLYLGRVTNANIELLQSLLNNTQYFWRVDPIDEYGPQTGPVYSFTVSRIGFDVSKIDERTIAGFNDHKVSIQMSSNEGAIAWTALSDDAWVSVEEDAGSTPSTLKISLDASALPIGINTSAITVTKADGELHIPVSLLVEPLNLTHIRSDRESSLIYAISEDTSNTNPSAYLLEVDSTTESILRIMPVGWSVTDFTIHYADDLLYIANWKPGNLLAIDRSSLSLTKTIEFNPAGPVGYSSGDVYRVAAGVSERIVVEEQDQWIELSLFDTKSATGMDFRSVREGGGAFDPQGRFYYHGENNSSGASIMKFDTSGDVFTPVTSIRPEGMSSYYGSRTVIVSEDGARVFWAGVVLDNDLEPEWQTGEIVYSSSNDGRYAFAFDAIYDVNLRRQVLSMPVGTMVSGYNSSSKKLVVEQNGRFRFYDVSSQSSVSAPALNITRANDDSIELRWTDETLEMGFVIQRKVVGSDEWIDVYVAQANETSWTDLNIVAGTNYEYRIKATSGNTDSSWSNVATTSEQPVAYDDHLTIIELQEQIVNVTENDIDPDGTLNLSSIVITSQPDFGKATVLADGRVSYRPNSNFELNDSFSYTVNDANGQISNEATVTVQYIPPPVLAFNAQFRNSVGIKWTFEAPETWTQAFEIQKRVLGTDPWETLPAMPADQTMLVISELNEAQVYEFRVRAISVLLSTQWSDIIQSSLAPVALADLVLIAAISEYKFDIAGNDMDPDGQININSIVIVEDAQFGQVVVETDGQVSYIPGDTFESSDSFVYTVADDNGIESNQVTVEIKYVAAPELDAGSPTHNAVTLSWSDNTHDELNFEFEIQQRRFGVSDWQTVHNASSGIASWTATNLLVQTSYEFRVRALGPEFETAWSNTSAINTLAAPVPPPPPAEQPPSGSSGGSTSIFTLALMMFAIFFRRVVWLRCFAKQNKSFSRELL